MRRLIIFGVAIAVLYTALWFIMADQAQTRIAALLAAQQADGISITAGTPRKSGFPFALRIAYPDFYLRDKSGDELAVPKLVLGVRITDWSHVTVDAPSGIAESSDVITATAENATGDIEFTSSRIKAVNLTLQDVAIAKNITITAHRLDIHFDQPEEHAIVNATGVNLPGSEIPGLGNAIRRLTLEATIMGGLPGIDEAALQAWSHDGGTLEIHEFSADWGALGLGMGGTLALDEGLQPVGSFNARITGFSELLTALAASHAIKPTNAEMLSLGLGLMAQPEGPDNLPTLTVPVTVQDGQVYVASFKLMRMPEIRLN